MVPSPSSFSANEKALLRVEARARRTAYVAGLSQAERDELEIALAELLAPLVSGLRHYAIYDPIGSEISLIPLTRREVAASPAYPAFASRQSPMLFRSGQCAGESPWGGAQPPHQAAVVIPELVLVPLLAVDSHGQRLGQGGGHYDRALPALREAGAPIIGVGWAIQMIEGDLPVEPWDVPLDGFASPSSLEMFR